MWVVLGPGGSPAVCGRVVEFLVRVVDWWRGPPGEKEEKGEKPRVARALLSRQRHAQGFDLSRLANRAGIGGHGSVLVDVEDRTAIFITPMAPRES